MSVQKRRGKEGKAFLPSGGQKKKKGVRFFFWGGFLNITRGGKKSGLKESFPLSPDRGERKTCINSSSSNKKRSLKGPRGKVAGNPEKKKKEKEGERSCPPESRGKRERNQHSAGLKKEENQRNYSCPRGGGEKEG